jgi:hypothetical protein
MTYEARLALARTRYTDVSAALAHVRAQDNLAARFRCCSSMHSKARAPGGAFGLEKADCAAVAEALEAELVRIRAEVLPVATEARRLARAGFATDEIANRLPEGTGFGREVSIATLLAVCYVWQG